MTRYAFQDEFDGPAGSLPDPARWRNDLGGGGWGHGELQTHTDSTANVFQDGQSHLVIRATREQPAAAGNGRPGVGYHSARITTRDTFAQQGGCFEARIRVTSQPGLWPAFWLMGRDVGTAGWPRCGEVDVLGDLGDSTVHSAVHAHPVPRRPDGGLRPGDPALAGWPAASPSCAAPRPIHWAPRPGHWVPPLRRRAPGPGHWAPGAGR